MTSVATSDNIINATIFGTAFSGSINLKYLNYVPAAEHCSSMILCALAEVQGCKVGRAQIPDYKVLFFVFRGTCTIVHDMLINLRTKGNLCAVQEAGFFVHSMIWAEISNRTFLHQNDFLDRLTQVSPARLILGGHSLGGALANAMLFKDHLELAIIWATSARSHLQALKEHQMCDFRHSNCLWFLGARSQ